MKNKKIEIDKNTDLAKVLLADMIEPKSIGEQLNKKSLEQNLKIEEFVDICTIPHLSNKYEDKWGNTTYGKWFIEFGEGLVTKDFWELLKSYQNLKLRKKDGTPDINRDGRDDQMTLWRELGKKYPPFQLTVGEFNLMTASSFWKKEPTYLRNFVLLGRPKFFEKTKKIERHLKYLRFVCKTKNLFVEKASKEYEQE